MKTKEELNALKEEVKALNKKLNELTEDELAQVTGGESSAKTVGRGKNGNPTLVLWDESSAGLVSNPECPSSIPQVDENAL